jgi:hypothetical protein
VIDRQARFRVALLAVAAVLAVMWFGFGGGESAVILIDFSISPRDFEGAEVFIDGEVAGKLERMGSRQQTGFRVEDGEHVVTLRHPEYRTRHTKVTSGFGAQRVLLVVDFGRGAGEEAILVLNH